MPASDPKLFWCVDVFRVQWFVKGDNDGQGRSRTIVTTVAREKKFALIVLQNNSSLLRKKHILPTTQCFFYTAQAGVGLISTTVKKRAM